MIFSFAACKDNLDNVIESNAVLTPENSSSSQITIDVSKPSDVSDIEVSSEEQKETLSSSSCESVSSSSASSNSGLSGAQNSNSENLSSSSSSSIVSESHSSSSSSSDEISNAVHTNLSDESETKAVWISYLEYQSVLTGKSKKDFKSNIRKMFSNICDDGYNTVFVHVRSHSDAVYDSDIFPWSVYCTGTEGEAPGFDPLEIMVDEAHDCGLKIEAWVNPYRIKGTSDTSKISKNSPAFDWLDTEKIIVLSSGIFYNPADEDVIDLVVSGVKEIVDNYDVDGIHFDDYFYPSTDNSIDSSYYSNYKKTGGKLSLASWRRQNVNTLIKRVYSAIKDIDPGCRFGISPTGNIQNNYDTLYCDVETWVTCSGYVDYICPQLYYGFNHGTQPYLTVLDKFNKMIENNNIELIVGLSAYKVGCSDGYAGNGKSEWQNNTDILSRQITAAREESNYGGFALYRYDSLYNPVSSVKGDIEKERENIKNII